MTRTPASAGLAVAGDDHGHALVVVRVDGDGGDVAASSDGCNKVIGSAKDVNGGSAPEEDIAGSKRNGTSVGTLYGSDPELVDTRRGHRRNLGDARGKSRDGSEDDAAIRTAQ